MNAAYKLHVGTYVPLIQDLQFYQKSFLSSVFATFAEYEVCEIKMMFRKAWYVPRVGKYIFRYVSFWIFKIRESPNASIFL
jgi:hypothetical protein